MNLRVNFRVNQVVFTINTRSSERTINDAFAITGCLAKCRDTWFQAGYGVGATDILEMLVQNRGESWRFVNICKWMDQQSVVKITITVHYI